jgi:ATP-dependent DNA helicase RecQ
VDTLAARLAERGWQVVPYHAGLDDATRQRHQFLFSRDKVPIVVATVAFGMGINKSNVRFVLHYNLTENLETYYQEIGRAGRDGLRADCLLLFARADMATIYTFIEQGAESERAGRHARLQAMVRYAEADGCRRALLLDYFGEQQAEPACGFCDNCLSAPTEEARLDATEAARKFLACVQRTGERFGVGHIVDVLRGSKARAVLRWRHDRLPMYGSGTEHAATEWRHLAGQFIRQGLLEQEMEHGTLRLTTRGRAVLAGEKVYVIPARALPALAAETPAYDMALFEHLRRLRRELAEAADVPPYVIFSDKSLVEMATYLPQSPPSFLAVHGVGERKLAQYGDRFLDLIRAYCVERGLPERPRPAGGSSGAGTAIGDRTAEVGRLFAGGLSAAELQDRYGVKQSTIVDHLYWYARSGNPLDAERVRQLSSLSPDRQARVLAALAECGPDRLRPIFDAMEGTIPYDELHILRLYFIVRERP